METIQLSSRLARQVLAPSAHTPAVALGSALAQVLQQGSPVVRTVTRASPLALE